MEVRVKHNVCAAPGGPANRLRIPPAFVADRYTERHRAGLKDAAAGAWSVGALFRGVYLDLVLKARGRSVRIDNEGGRQQRTVDEAFCSENGSDVGFRGGFGEHRPGAFEELGIGSRHGLPRPSIARHEAFRKTDDSRPFDGGLFDRLLCERNRLLRTGRKPDIGKRDSKWLHAFPIIL